ncbi:MAG: TetR/AcrR family transcriptional regulator [Alphaproteobacteria bacterium]|nr:MAG: TetR/AcrR family transcriptional regulator [Alphaproteobacteria bacterium]
MATLEDKKPRHKAKIREENQQLILRAAEAVFAEAGFKGATTAAIAERAGLPKANVHFYFSTKRELYQEVLSDILEEWFEAAGSFDAGRSPAEALTVYIRTKMEMSRQRPLGSRVWANEVLHGATMTSEEVWDRMRPWFEDCVLHINRWISEGKMDPVEPQFLMYMIWATTQHYADFASQIEILNGGEALSDDQFEAAINQTTGIILKGLGIQER